MGYSERYHPHDLTVLYRGIKESLQLPDEIEESLPELSMYYVTARYPNAGLKKPSQSFSRTQALRAIEVARSVLREIERALYTTQNTQGY